MAYLVRSGAKSLGKVKTKKQVDKLLSKEYRKDNRVSVLKIRKAKKK